MGGSPKCPHCGKVITDFKHPFLVVDAVIAVTDDSIPQIVLIERKNIPYGWALPGGFVDYGESTEAAVVREAKEETNLDISDVELVGVFSNPKRDSRAHMVGIAYSGQAIGQTPKAQDDAKNIEVVSLLEALDMALVFDHHEILMKYYQERLAGIDGGKF